MRRMSSTGDEADPEGVRWRWKTEDDSLWWNLCSEPGGCNDEGTENWSGLKFRLTDRKKRELRGVSYPRAHQPAIRYSDISPGLQDILQDVTSFQIISRKHRNIDELLTRVLKMVKHPAPVLERLDVTLTLRTRSGFDLGILLDAAKAGKLIGCKVLRFSGVDNTGLKFLAAVIGTGLCSSLSSLSLRDSHFTSEGMKILAASLKLVGDSLTYLSLEGNQQMDTSGHVAVALALESGHLPKLESLYLKRNEIGSDVCEAYGKAMSSGNLEALQEISLDSCSIDDKGAKALARGFQTGMLKKLAVLKLGSNRIGDDGLIALTTSLQVGGFSSLTHLDLSLNKWSDNLILHNWIPHLEQANKSGNQGSLTKPGSGSASCTQTSKEMEHVFIAEGVRWRWKGQDSCLRLSREIKGNADRSVIGIAEDPENWSGLVLQLTDEKQKELQETYPPADQPAFRYSDISAGLQNILQGVISFQISSHCTLYNHAVNGLLSNVLQMVKNPAPVLERLDVTIDAYHKFDLGILLGAAKAGKLIGLKFLRVTGIDDTGLQCLAAVIGTGLCSSLSSLSVRDSHFTSRGMKALAASLNFVGNSLTKLSLEGNQLMDEFGHVAVARAMESGHLPKLETLNLQRNNLQRNSIRHSACGAYGKAISSGNLEALKEINLETCGIDDEGAEALARGYETGKLQNLAVLKLGCNDIGDDGLIALTTSLQVGEFSSLTHLDFSFNRWSNNGIPSLEQAIKSGTLSSLTNLNLRNTWNSREVAEAVLSALRSQESPKVTKVDLDWGRYPDLESEYELMVRNAKYRLDQLGDEADAEGVRWRWISEGDSSWLSLHGEFKGYVYPGSSIAEDTENWSGLEFLLAGEKQKVLRGCYPRADQPAFRYCEISAGLQDVFEDVNSFRIIPGNSLIDDLLPNFLKMVRNSPPVPESDVTHTVPLDAPKAGKLIGLKYIHWNQTDDAGLEFLAAVIGAGLCSSLLSLSLQDSQSTARGWKTLAASLNSVGSSLTSDTNIQRDASDHVARTLESGQLPKLEILNLQRSFIGSEACEVTGKAISSGNLEALKEINLYSCGIDDKGAKSLASGFETGMLKNLAVLNLGSNKIGDDGVIALARGFESGELKNLAVLNLGSNKIGDDGVIALVTTLEVGALPSLTHLDLNFSCSEKCFPSLARAIRSGNLRSLTKLEVRGHPVSKQMAEVLLLALLSQKSPKVTEMDFDWGAYPDLRRKFENLMIRNQKHQNIMTELGDASMVPATFGKVYLCGDPEAGKTTLRKSLGRSYFRSLMRWERRQRKVESTRGIDVSVLSTKNPENWISLFLWDVAGQNEYHMIHNSFFPDLGTEEGKATTFVFVCRSDDIRKAQEQLRYWLRFIASSVNKDIQSPRQVCVVVNRSRGDSQVLKNALEWEKMVEHEGMKFVGRLNVSNPVFYADVRKRKAVETVKHYLIQSIQSKLEGVQVPDICQFVQTHLVEWIRKREHFPVLAWEAFMRLALEAEAQWDEKTLKAAMEYLSESGVVIFIDKKFPPEWNISYQVLLILDPNWFCREIAGAMFVPAEMRRQGEFLFREKVESQTGSIPINVFNEWLKDVVVGWDNSNFDNLMIILLWLGLCYVESRQQNLFIPSLANGASSHPASWNWKYGEGSLSQWVMGYYVDHAPTTTALAPISLWHKFQVKLAQSPTYNDQGPMRDNDFTTGKHFISFVVNSMVTLIIVHASDPNRPTFESIIVYVKPLFREEEETLELNDRKQCQVDLASNLVETLTTLWVEVCPSIDYIESIVWPCPTSHFKLPYERVENLEVSLVRDAVQLHGMGRRMNRKVGEKAIMREQLLSTSDKKFMVRSLKDSISQGRDILRGGMSEAMKLLIIPNEEPTKEQAFETFSQHDVISLPQSATEIEQYFDIKLSHIQRGIDIKLGNIQEGVDKANQKLERVIEESQSVSTLLMDLMRVKGDLVRKVKDVGEMFLEDKERSCPKFIHLGTEKGVWMTLKTAMSPKVTSLVRFACEAEYQSYGQHIVEGQLGIQISELKPWAKKLLPWLRVSLTFLYISAKLTANVIAPGMGLILPNCPQWQEASSLAEGLQSVTGYSRDELDELMGGQVDFGAKATLDGMKEIYGKSRLAITELLGNLTVQELEEKLRLRKVHLRYTDGSSHGVVWICNDCFEKFRAEHLVREL